MEGDNSVDNFSQRHVPETSYLDLWPPPLLSPETDSRNDCFSCYRFFIPSFLLSFYVHFVLFCCGLPSALRCRAISTWNVTVLFSQSVIYFLSESFPFLELQTDYIGKSMSTFLIFIAVRRVQNRIAMSSVNAAIEIGRNRDHWLSEKRSNDLNANDAVENFMKARRIRDPISIIKIPNVWFTSVYQQDFLPARSLMAG